MFVGAPLVKAEQDRSVRVEDLPEIVMGRRRLRLTEQRLVPLEAASHITYPDDRPRALHGRSSSLTNEANRHSGKAGSRQSQSAPWRRHARAFSTSAAICTNSTIGRTPYRPVTPSRSASLKNALAASSAS